MKNYWIRGTTLLFVYLGLTKLGLVLDSVNEDVPFIWLASGVALALSFYWGVSMAPFILIASFLFNRLIAPFNTLESILLASANALEIVCAVLILRQYQFSPRFDRIKDVSALLFSGTVGAAVGASVGGFTFWIFGRTHDHHIFFAPIMWWMGDVLSFLVITPFLFLSTSLALQVSFKNISIKRCVEFSLILLSIVLASLGIFGVWHNAVFSGFSNLYLIFPIVVWAAVRFTHLGAVVTTLWIAMLGTISTTGQYDIFIHHEGYWFLHLQIFTAVVAMSGLTLASYVKERTFITLENINLYNQARRAVEIRNDFLSIASHELMTPVTALLFQLETTKRTLERSKDETVSVQKVKETLGGSIQQVRKITALIENLLDVSRIEGGKLILDNAEVNISDAIKNVVTGFEEQLAHARCEVKLEIDPGVIVYCDPLRVEQIMVNLISNAIKYAAGTNLIVKLKTEKDLAVLSVQDGGPGIPEEHHSRVFERFSRATKSRGISGLGLGLFIVKEIVKAHKGDLHLENVEEGGARFVVKLPIRKIQEA